jgi:hypothetical protein
VFDAFDVMVHLFTTEKRRQYRLELLWKDASDVPMNDLLVARISPKRAASSLKKKAS